MLQPTYGVVVKKKQKKKKLLQTVLYFSLRLPSKSREEKLKNGMYMNFQKNV